MGTGACQPTAQTSPTKNTAPFVPQDSLLLSFFTAATLKCFLFSVVLFLCVSSNHDDWGITAAGNTSAPW